MGFLRREERIHIPGEERKVKVDNLYISTLYGDKGFSDPCVAGVLNFPPIQSTLATLACYGTPDPSALCIESASGPFSRSEGVSKLVLTLA